MKATLDTLNELFRTDTLNPEDYYTISIWRNEIKLQGNYASNLVKKLKIDTGAKFTLDEVNGYVEGRFKTVGGTKIEIVLT